MTAFVNRESRSTDLRITEVKTAEQWQVFHQLKVDLYQDDPVAINPLKSIENIKLSEASPFFAHATRTAWICFDGDRCIGRVVGIVDRLHNDYNQDKLGFFGFFECVDNVDAARLLLDHAAGWLKEQGCDGMRGPMSPSMKGEMGVLIDGFEYPPTIMMAHSRPWYASLLEACGLDVVKSFYAFRFISDDPQHAKKFVKMDQFEERVMKRYPELRFEQISRENFAHSVHEVVKLGNEVRKNGWGFVPSTTEEIDAMIKNLGPIIRHEAFLVAYYGDEMVGYVISIPDVNWAFGKTIGKWEWLRKIQLLYWLRRIPRARIIALGASEKFRKKGIGMLLIKGLVDRRAVFKEWEMSWVLEDNINSLRAIDRTVNLDRYKTYQVFEKSLT